MARFLIFGALATVLGSMPVIGGTKQVDAILDKPGTENAPSKHGLPYGTYSLPDPNGVQMEALIAGRLQLINGCLYIGSGYIAVFPSEHTIWDPDKEELVILGKRLAIGDTVKTNGGYVERGAAAEAMLVDPIRASCAGDTFVVVGTEAWTR